MSAPSDVRLACQIMPEAGVFAPARLFERTDLKLPLPVPIAPRRLVPRQLTGVGFTHCPLGLGRLDRRLDEGEAFDAVFDRGELDALGRLPAAARSLDGRRDLGIDVGEALEI